MENLSIYLFSPVTQRDALEIAAQKMAQAEVALICHGRNRRYWHADIDCPSRARARVSAPDVLRGVGPRGDHPGGMRDGSCPRIHRFHCSDRSHSREVPRRIAETGFRVNDTKTRLQVASFGRRTITGVAVDNKIQATCAARRKLRAALHNKNQTAARGLEEWIKTKMPGTM